MTWIKCEEGPGLRYEKYTFWAGYEKQWWRDGRWRYDDFVSIMEEFIARLDLEQPFIGG